MLLFEDHASMVYALAFSPDGSLLASGARDGSIRLRGVDGTVVSVQEPSPNHGAIYALSFHPDTPVLAIGGEIEQDQAFGGDVDRREAAVGADGGRALKGRPAVDQHPTFAPVADRPDPELCLLEPGGVGQVAAGGIKMGGTR